MIKTIQITILLLGLGLMIPTASYAGSPHYKHHYRTITLVSGMDTIDHRVLVAPAPVPAQ